VFAGVEEDLIDAGRVGFERAAVRAYPRRRVPALEEGAAGHELSA
jgi:hypothetical protein